MKLALDNGHTSNNAPSTRSPTVDKERIRPRVLVSALCYFRILTLLLGRQVRHLAHKSNLWPFIPKRSLLEQDEEENWGGMDNPASH